MYKLLRPILFQLPEETTHKIGLKLLEYLPSYCFGKIIPPLTPVQALGYTFNHPIGLAAGLDKNGEYISSLAKLGFSFIEVGTITPRPQAGNPKPRLFRIPQAQALINRMGFNNVGVDRLVENIRSSNYAGILGINIGKNKATSLIQAKDDYVYCLRRVYEHASYVTVNISSPNTPKLRELQSEEYLEGLVFSLKQQQLILSQEYQKYVPLLIKLSPDESQENLRRMSDIFLKHRVDGVIATNTTINQTALHTYKNGRQDGGLSGQPLRDKATQTIRFLRNYIGREIVIIGAGGVDSVESAQEKIRAGAELIQIYTGIIYQGPRVVSNIVNLL
jgi:dihydroorotate dehydrogenase